jgi:hypothetical protein
LIFAAGGRKLNASVQLDSVKLAEGGKSDMADDRKEHTCARDTCGCPVKEGDKYCGEECENAHKVNMMEIGCTCHHPEC